MSVERSATGVPGATIREVPFISDVLAGAVPAGEFSVARPGALLRVIPGLARFLVRDGLTIDVAIEPGADRDEVQEFLDGAVLGALIHQRGELPLHAATLVPPGAGRRDRARGRRPAPASRRWPANWFAAAGAC